MQNVFQFEKKNLKVNFADFSDIWRDICEDFSFFKKEIR